MKPIPWNAKLWKESVTQFLEYLNPLIAGLGRSERRVAATRYVEGLLMPGQRKSIIPMAERLGVDPQRLQQFVTDSPWSEEEMWRAIRQEIIPHLGPVSSTTQASHGSQSGMIPFRVPRHISSSLHGLSVTNCCSLCESTPSRSAMGMIDLRCPGISSPST